MERFPLVVQCLLSVVSGDTPANLRESAVTGVARFGAGSAGDLCFCDREPGPEISGASAGAFVLCTETIVDALRARFPGAICLPVPDPRSVFIDFCGRLAAGGSIAVSDSIPRPFGLHPSAWIGAQTMIHQETRIDAGVSVGSQCVIERGTWIQSGTVIRDHTTVGVAGMNAYRGLDGRRRGFPHLAAVVIGEGVEIGAGAVVARGILTSTRIGRGTIIGCLCSIGHGVEIGESAWMAAGSRIGGHATIGAGATLGLGVVVRDNIAIGNGAQLGMGSVVTRSVQPNASVFGNPARVVPPLQSGPIR